MLKFASNNYPGVDRRTLYQSFELLVLGSVVDKVVSSQMAFCDVAIFAIVSNKPDKVVDDLSKQPCCTQQNDRSCLHKWIYEETSYN